MKTTSEKSDFEEMVKAAEKEAKRKIKVIQTSRNSWQLVWADDVMLSAQD